MSQQSYVCEKVDNKEDREKIECETKTRAREFQKQKQNFFSKHWPSTNIKANQKCRNEQIYRKELLLYNDRTEMRCVERVCVWARKRAHLNREREKCVSCKEKFAPPMFNYLYKWKETKAKRKETDKREWEDRRTSTFFIMWIRNEKFNSHPKSPHSPTHTHAYIHQDH